MKKIIFTIMFLILSSVQAFAAAPAADIITDKVEIKKPTLALVVSMHMTQDEAKHYKKSKPALQEIRQRIVDRVSQNLNDFDVKIVAKDVIKNLTTDELALIQKENNADSILDIEMTGSGKEVGFLIGSKISWTVTIEAFLNKNTTNIQAYKTIKDDQSSAMLIGKPANVSTFNNALYSALDDTMKNLDLNKIKNPS